MLWTLAVLLATLQGSRSLLRTNTRLVRLNSPSGTSLVRREAATTSTTSSSSSTTAAADCGCDQFADSFVAQKNFLLLEKFERPENGNLTDAAMQYVNFCDESFDLFLNDKIALLPTEPEKQKYGKIRYAVNTARQRKLMEADVILRTILEQAKVGVKQMEAKLMYYLRRCVHMYYLSDSRRSICMHHLCPIP